MVLVVINHLIDNVKRPDDIFTGLFGSGSPSWPVSRYLNIWVCDLNYATRKCPTCLTLCDTCGALGGYAYPPANAINWGGLALEEVVMTVLLLILDFLD